MILENSQFLSRWSSVLEAFRQDVFHSQHSASAYYRPVFMVSLILDAHWAGVAAWGYHLTSLLVHLAASCALFQLLAALRYPRAAALAASIAFAIHPALRQDVLLIAGRDEALLGLFSFASFTAFLKYVETPSRLCLLRHLAFFALALFSKETGVVMIPVCLLYLHWIVREEIFSSRKMALGPAWLAIVCGWALLRRNALAAQPLKLDTADMIVSIMTNLSGILQFLGKSLLPANLTDMPLVSESTLAYGLAALILLAAGLWRNQERRWSYAAFGASWFCLFVLPSLVLQSTTFGGILPEKRLYVPLAGFFIVCLETSWGKSVTLSSGGPRMQTALALAALAALTWRYTGHYRDRLAFWERVAADSPRVPLNLRNLGAMYQLDGRLDEAEAQYHRALKLNAAEPMVHNNLGLILMGRGKLREAEALFLRELAVNPGYDNALYNLGLLYDRAGRLEEAQALWQKTLAKNPDHAGARQHLLRHRSP